MKNKLKENNNTQNCADAKASSACIVSKYNLALQTIKRPVKYDQLGQMIFDSEGNLICQIRGWGHIQYLSNPEKRQNQIGELIVELINAC